MAHQFPWFRFKLLFFLWGHVKDGVSGRRRHSLPERSQLAALPFASVPPHYMVENTGGGLLTAVTSAVSAASKMWRFNETSSTVEYL